MCCIADEYICWTIGAGNSADCIDLRGFAMYLMCFTVGLS